MTTPQSPLSLRDISSYCEESPLTRGADNRFFDRLKGAFQKAPLLSFLIKKKFKHRRQGNVIANGEAIFTFLLKTQSEPAFI